MCGLKIPTIGPAVCPTLADGEAVVTCTAFSMGDSSRSWAIAVAGTLLCRVVICDSNVAMRARLSTVFATAEWWRSSICFCIITSTGFCRPTFGGDAICVGAKTSWCTPTSAPVMVGEDSGAAVGTSESDAVEGGFDSNDAVPVGVGTTSSSALEDHKDDILGFAAFLLPE